MNAIVVQIAPEPAPAFSRALLNACNDTVRTGSCVRDDNPDREPFAVAIVRVDSDTKRITIEVGPKSRAESDWEQRSLDFDDADPLLERWRSVGLTIATLANEITTPEKAAPAPTSETKNDSAKPATPSHALEEPARGDTATSVGPVAPSWPPSRSRTELWFDASAIAGLSRSDASFRVGASLAVALRPPGLPFFARLAGSFIEAPADPRGVVIDWATARADVGAILERRGFALSAEPRIGVAFTRTEAFVENAGGAAGATGGRWGYDFVAGGQGVWRLGILSPLFGADLALENRPTQILLENRPLTRISRYALDFFLGVRLEPF